MRICWKSWAFMLHALGAIFGLVGTGCSSNVTPGAPREFVVSGQQLAPPQNLYALAADIRSDGGVVFVSNAIGPRTSIEPDTLPGPDAELFIAYPRETADVVVLDALGTTDLPASLNVTASSGQAEMTDSEGNVVDGWIITDSGNWRDHAFPSDGKYVYFLIPSDGQWFIRSARSVDERDMVDGTGTVDGTSVPVSSLATTD